MMFKKATVKIIGISLGIIILAFLCFIGLRYCKYQNAQLEAKDRVGYLDPNKTSYNENFTRCNKEKLPYGYYHSSNKQLYRGSKKRFFKTVIDNYKASKNNASGFLNLRFLLNCEGAPGRLEVNELDTNYSKSDLDDDLVFSLVQIAMDKNNWDVLPNSKRDFYLYLIFKIENGKVTEIIP